jgi:solute carrier family 45 protein 1/2/4
MKDIEVGTPGYDAHASPKRKSTAADGDSPAGNYPSIWLLLAVSLPRMALQMAWSAQWAALGPYLQTMLPNFAVQITQYIGPICGTIIGPSIGVFSDRCTSRWGRRRPFLITAAIGSVICWILMGYTREIGDALGDHGSGATGESTDRTWTSIFTVFFYLWMDITCNVVQTPAMLLIADLAGERQTTGAALGQAWSTLGSILVAGYIEFFGAAYNSIHAFMGMLSVVMAVCVGVACIFGKETPLDKSQVVPMSTCKSLTVAFGSIWTGLRTLPSVLVAYCVMFFFVQYGYTAYNGNKGQFFGLEVYGGSAENADSCGDACSEQQLAYNRGVTIAGGRADLLFNVVGYLFAWALPFLVRKFGAKWTLTISVLPQIFLLGMAWSKNLTFDVFVVTICGVTQNGLFALLVPVIIHVFGPEEDIGMYVGAINSANCFGQLLNFIVGTALVQTSLGYKLPVFVGGCMSLLGFLTGAIFLKLKMNSM